MPPEAQTPALKTVFESVPCALEIANATRKVVCVANLKAQKYKISERSGDRHALGFELTADGDCHCHTTEQHPGRPWTLDVSFDANA